MSEHLYRWTKPVPTKPWECGERHRAGDDEWNRILRRVAVVLQVCKESHGVNVQWHADSDYKLGPKVGRGPAQLNAFAVRFNGVEGEGAELFELTRGGTMDYQGSWHCDTKGKPYDLAVRAVLLIAHEEIGLLVIGEGYPEEWTAARAVVDGAKKQKPRKQQDEELEATAGTDGAHSGHDGHGTRGSVNRD